MGCDGIQIQWTKHFLYCNFARTWCNNQVSFTYNIYSFCYQNPINERMHPQKYALLYVKILLSKIRKQETARTKHSETASNVISLKCWFFPYQLSKHMQSLNQHTQRHENSSHMTSLLQSDDKNCCTVQGNKYI